MHAVEVSRMQSTLLRTKLFYEARNNPHQGKVPYHINTKVTCAEGDFKTTRKIHLVEARKYHL
jgi:hypothetical protein